MDNIVTAKVVGDWLGVSDRTVSDLAIRGHAKKIGRGQYDLRETVRLYTAHLREMAAGRGDGGSLDLTQERARLAKLQADGQEIKNAQTRGELVLRDDVLRGWQDIIRKVRSGMLAVPARIQQQIPTIGTSETILIDREIREALEALADGSDHYAGGADEPQTATENQAFDMD